MTSASSRWRFDNTAFELHHRDLALDQPDDGVEIFAVVFLELRHPIGTGKGFIETEEAEVGVGAEDKLRVAEIGVAGGALADADFGYFDENQDGKITRSEFVEKPSVFILRFDKNDDCKVTQEEIRAAATPATDPRAPQERPRDRFHPN